MKKIKVIYAPNVHQGGGRILLLPLINQMKNNNDAIFIIDKRLKLPSNLKLLGKVHYVNPNFFSRLLFELRLKYILNENSCLLAMGNLPPLFAHQGTQYLFIQNKLLLSPVASLKIFPKRVQFRLITERWWLRAKTRFISVVIVQTNVMKKLALQHLHVDAEVLPFVHKPNNKFQQEDSSEPQYDFIYVASGDPHKNHLNLINSWVLMAKDGYFPRLALTLNESRFKSLCAWISKLTNEHNLKIYNIGEQSQSNILSAYSKSRALIYPSLCESFGLPLIEAVHENLPILAANLDYVWELIEPTDTFDPEYPRSIADAVICFSYGKSKLRTNLLSAKEFLHKTILRDDD